MTASALNGITVLDLGNWISAPFCAVQFANYGADVIKVEPPHGDTARRASPFPEDIPDPEKSGLYLSLNTNKRGITLNLETAGGRAILKELASQADLLVENHPPGYMESIGLSYDALHAINPRLVVTSVTPFGLSGPYRDYQTTDLVSFALTNRMHHHGVADREPINYAPDIPWFQAGSTAAAASVAAVLSSRATGSGQMVEISAMECMVGNVDARNLFYQYTGAVQIRGAPGAGYPAGAYPCQDGYVVFAAGGDRFFRRLCRAMGRTDLLDDSRWATAQSRPGHQEAFEEVLLTWLMERPKAQVFAECQRDGVMCAPVNTVEDLFNDLQIVARGFFSTVDNTVAGPLTMAGAPYLMSETPWAMRMPAPTLGQHNSEIYRDHLGYSQNDLTMLRSMGVI